MVGDLDGPQSGIRYSSGRMRDMRGTFGENTTLYPDVEVYNSPEDYITGHDPQLIRAVEEMMKSKERGIIPRNHLIHQRA